MGSRRTELALCVHSPVGLESLAGLEIPRGRKQGTVCCATLSLLPGYPRGKNDSVRLPQVMGLVLRSAPKGQQVRLWARGERLQLEDGGGGGGRLELVTVPPPPRT